MSPRTPGCWTAATAGCCARCCSARAAATPSGCTTPRWRRCTGWARTGRPAARWPRCWPGTATPGAGGRASTFPGRVGVAAGMDKNGAGPAGLGRARLRLRRAGHRDRRGQPGNARPRLFRLPEHRAMVNRMGFNNAGAAALAARLAAAGVVRGNRAVGIPLGISLGKTKTTPLAEATADYLASFRLLAPATPTTSPSTSPAPTPPGCARCRTPARCASWSGTLVAEARRRDPDAPVPVFVKLAPDLSDDALEELLAVCTDAGAAGLVATNTTLARDGVGRADRHAGRGGRALRRPAGRAGPGGRRLPHRPHRPAGDRRRRHPHRRRRPGDARRRARSCCRSTPATSTAVRRWSPS